ncbi:MAG TPA: phage protein Gp36 family protein [Longimicrobium sp.]|jgi:phage gp36-like protein
MYASAADLLERFPENDLIQLTDPNGAVLNVGKLEAALADASAEIDGYLQARYPLPLPRVPAHLKTLACTIAVYRLQIDRRTETIADIRKQYEDAVRLLERVNAGTHQLGITVDQQPVQQSSGIEVLEGTRVFSRGSMGGY